MYDLWPPADYPNLTAPTPTVTGCTRDSTVSGLSTFTAQTPAVDAVTTRLIRPIFVKGQGGVLRWSVSVANTTGNMLTANQASGTDTLSDTTGFTTSSATATSSTDEALQGSRSLKVVTSANSGRAMMYGSTTSGTMPVEPGETYTFRVDAKQTAGTALLAVAYIYWWTSAGNVAASTASVNGTGVVLTSSWQTVSVTATAPANAAFASMWLGRGGSGTAVMTRYEDRHGFWKGTGGDWSMPGQRITGVTGGPAMEVQAQVIFLDDDDAQVDRWTGPAWTIEDSIVLSARLPVPRRATQAQLKVLSACGTPAATWTEYDSRLEQIPADDPYVPPAVDVFFGDMSPEGVAPPAPPAGLPGFEANSPARRSPQVRWCQLHDSIRPDLTPKKNAREV